MDTTVKYFHSEMPNAPVLSGTAGALIAVLDACLVTGWGLLSATSASVSAGVCTLNFASTHSFEPLNVALIAGAGVGAVNGEKRISSTGATSISFPVTGVPDGPVSGAINAKLVPANWTKLAGANRAAYKSTAPDASACWARIDDTNARFGRLRAYETMTDVDTGVGPTPTDAQQGGGLYIPKSDSASTAMRRWVVVASDRFVFVATANSGMYPNDYAMIAFGDFASLKSGDAYNFIVVGDTADTSGSASPGYNNALHAAANGQGAFVVRSYVQSGGAVPVYLFKPGFTSNNWSGYQAPGAFPVGPNPINNAIEICPTLLYEGGFNGNRRGDIPGLYGIPHALGSGFDNKAQLTPAIGLPGHVLITLRFGGYASASGSARCAIDVTGPWI